MSNIRIGGLWILFLVLTVGVIGCSGEQTAVEPTQQIATTEAFSPTAAMIQRHLARYHQAATQLALVQRPDPPGFADQLFSQPGDPEPVHIPGGIIPGVAHLWLPGPVELGFMGTNVEPSTFTDFHGDVAIAYLAGTTIGSDGNEYDMFHDMRVMKGNYVSVDGTHHRGTFAFI